MLVRNPAFQNCNQFSNYRDFGIFKTQSGQRSVLYHLDLFYIFQFLKGIESKSRELKDVEKSCEIVRQNVDKLNKEMANNMEELENKESKLKDVESRIQLSLRFVLGKSFAKLEKFYHTITISLRKGWYFTE